MLIATPTDKPLNTTRPQLRVLQALEIIFGYPWSASIGIWTIGGLGHAMRAPTNHNRFGKPDCDIDA